jgi:hypothetical protein
MEHEHALSALFRKRGEIAGLIEAAQATLRELLSDLDAVDATILLFNPEADLGMIKTKPAPPRFQTFRGEMQRHCLNMLRLADKPITSLDITLKALEARGINPNEQRSVVLVRKRVSAALYKLGERGVIRSIPLDGEYKGWELVR